MQTVSDIGAYQQAGAFDPSPLDVCPNRPLHSQRELQGRMPVRPVIAGVTGKERPPWAERNAPGPGGRLILRFHRPVRSRNALPTTDTEDRLMANAAIIGLSNQPNTGYNAPAAIGTPSAL